MKKFRSAIALLSFSLLLLSACGDDDPAEFSSDSRSSAAAGGEQSDTPGVSPGVTDTGASDLRPGASGSGQIPGSGGAGTAATAAGTPSVPSPGDSGSGSAGSGEGTIPADSAAASGSGAAPSGQGSETTEPTTPVPSAEPTTPVPTPVPSETVPTLAEVHAQVFQGTCTGCHGTRGGLSLANNAGLRDRLLANSTQLPSMPLVTPGDATRSYLWHKMANTHRDVDGTGTVMPPAGSVSGERLDILLAWIEGGAP